MGVSLGRLIGAGAAGHGRHGSGCRSGPSREIDTGSVGASRGDLVRSQDPTSTPLTRRARVHVTEPATQLAAVDPEFVGEIIRSHQPEATLFVELRRLEVGA
jgi:hypothetical protein